MSNQIFTFDDVFILSEKLNTNKYAAIVQTDTVIGIVSHNPELIYQIKNRPSNKKLILLISNIDDVKSLTDKERKVINKYWPGGLTIIKNQVSYRMPNHDDLLTLIDFTGPLYSSSANISGKEPIKNTLDAFDEFSQNASKLLIVEGKTLSNQPSTIVDLDQMKVIRNGKINGNKIIEELCK